MTSVTAPPDGAHAAVVARAMGDPLTYPRPPDGVEAIEAIETHASQVFLAGDRAYKVKKPVVLSFLDQGTLARRRALCRDEVRLNRRLAPRIYLRTVALVRRGEGFALVADDDPAARDAIEFAVEMRRFARADTLAARAVAQQAAGRDAVRVGHLLAGFHHVAARSRNGAAATAALEAAMRTTLDDLAAAPPDLVDGRRIAALRRFLTAFMRGRAPELGRRAARGLVRDGHGDLRAEHVVLTDPPQVVDCLEFDPSLRIADVAADLAFLMMDLEALGAPRLARGVVDAYRRAGGDAGDDRLLAGLACHRALVRAKVASVRAAQADDRAGPDAAELARLLTLAERLAWRARGPVVLVCCGPAASGKSTLAAALSRSSGLPHLSSDVVRKTLAGVAPTARAPIDAYAPDVTALTYRALAARAADAAVACGGAIVDATFHTRATRDAFLDALAHRDVPVLFAECRAGAAVLERRAQARMRDPARVSDATPEIVRRGVGEWERFAPGEARRHLVVPAEAPPASMADHVVAWLDRRLEDERAASAATRRRP